MIQRLGISVVYLFLATSCSLTVVKPRPSTTQFHPTNYKSKECVLIARKQTAEEHFEERFNASLTNSDAGEQLAEIFERQNLAKRVVPFTGTIFRTSSVVDLRSYAAMFGCDAVFSYREQRVYDASLNFWSLLYPSLIGMFLFPGNNLQVALKWDVEYLESVRDEKIFSGEWYGVSPLYHFRPGSLALVKSRGYKAALRQLIASGAKSLTMKELKRP